MPILAKPRGGFGGTYLPTFIENMGLVICPNLHRNSEGGVEMGRNVLVILQYQYRKSQILVLLSDEKCDCTIDRKNAYNLVNISEDNY